METVVKLSLKKDTPKIEVTMEPDEESNYTPEEKITYQKIKAYILEKYGFKVSSLYIAQIKDKCGLGKERTGNNWKKNDKSKEPQCTPEKEEAIRDFRTKEGANNHEEIWLSQNKYKRTAFRQRYQGDYSLL